LIRYHCVNVECITEMFYDYFKCVCVVGGWGRVFVYFGNMVIM